MKPVKSIVIFQWQLSGCSLEKDIYFKSCDWESSKATWSSAISLQINWWQKLSHNNWKYGRKRAHHVSKGIHFLIGKLLSSYKMRIRYLKCQFSASEGEVSLWLPGWGQFPHLPYLQHLPSTIHAEIHTRLSDKCTSNSPETPVLGRYNLSPYGGAWKWKINFSLSLMNRRPQSRLNSDSTCGSQSSAMLGLHLWSASTKVITWLLLALLGLL